MDIKDVMEQVEAKNPEAAKSAEDKEDAPSEKKESGAADLHVEPKPEITYDDFAKCQFAVGEILSCKEVPKSKKLLVSKVKVGDQTRQIVSGIKKWYKPEEMVGKRVMVLLNLKPAKLAGVLSEGMLLAAEDADGNICLIRPEKDVLSGSEIA